MSAPARIGTCMSAIALVRPKRGSTWMIFAPRSGLHRPAEADRMRLGHRGALDQDAVGVLQVLLEGVAPPRPNEVPRPGTVEVCHMRAWFSIWTAPIAVKAFLIR